MSINLEVLKSYVVEKPSNISFEVERLIDHSYLTHLIFSPNKPGTKDEQFSLLIEMLLHMELSNPFLGGVLTNLSYRYNENKEKYGFILPYLFMFKKSYDHKADTTKPIFSRWLISSTNTLGTIALMEGNVDEAKQIFERGLKKYALSAHTPLLYMNLCMTYFQYGLIKYQENHINLAISILERCYYLSISAINEIYTARNEFVLSMKMDCEKIIEVGLEALKAKEIISSNKILSGSRVPKIKQNNDFKVEVVLGRFKHSKSIWHNAVECKINEVKQ